MKVTSITVEVGRTLPTGNYSSVKLGATASATLDEPVASDSVEFRRAYSRLYRDTVKVVMAAEGRYVEKNQQSQQKDKG